ncbi:MAG TPA: BtpA/SgcQ family protein [Candidatus Limnocylindrales bacterium]|jgi:predicted TIM-barrel enzyme|nr:BtpA/SgcQ family protein [Candidatus Limnocylindrales bacterium]
MKSLDSEHKDAALIGMLHVPINTIIAGPAQWRLSLGLPAAWRDDWDIINKLPAPITDDQDGACVAGALEGVRALSFWPTLEDRFLSEARCYQRNGVNEVIIENVAAPYFVRSDQPPVIYWCMRALAELLKRCCPSFRVGIQVLACADHWAMEIACRTGLDFIRCESALFEGLRPEGRTANEGNLAKLYLMRNLLMAQLGLQGPGPQVYVDLHKKHTLFMPGLDSLEPWLQNILFQKIEGAIITGKATGDPAAEADLGQARAAIESVKKQTASTMGKPWAPPLIVGSGVSPDNIGMCKRYADAVIVGSAIKEGGYWECALDERRLQSLIEAWHAS